MNASLANFNSSNLASSPNFEGKKDKISNYYNKNIYIVNVSPHGKYYNIKFIYNNKPIVVSSKNIKLFF